MIQHSLKEVTVVHGNNMILESDLGSNPDFIP